MKNNKIFACIFIVDLILGIIFHKILIDNISNPIEWMPLIATNFIVPFYALDSGKLKHKWQIIFLFIVPYSSIMFILFDSLCDAAEEIKEKWEDLR